MAGRASKQTMDRLREMFEFPLFVRELTESANRKRTYALRVLTALIVIMVFGVVYFEMTWEQTTVYQMLGSGNTMAVAVLITNIIAIFVLLPAMSCSAIALEREKQTLSLLLISGLTPGTIVIEKWLSRMMPILVMLIASSPVLGIAYVCGGFGTEQLLLMIIVMLIATIQVASTAIFCSSFTRSAVSAFWWTYIVMAFVIFAPMLLQESGLFPRINFRFLSSGPSEQLGFAFVVYLISIESFMYRAFDVTEVFWCAIPPISMAICMLIASRFALIRVGTGEGLSFALQIRNLKSTAITKFKQLIKSGLPDLTGNENSANAISQWIHQPSGTASRVPAVNSLGWRERQSSMMSRWMLYVGLAAFMVTIELWCYAIYQGYSYEWVGQGIVITTEILLSIISLLIVISLGCRVFAGESERQTLDSLLVLPITNRELLRQKCAGVNRAILYILCLFVVAIGVHLLIGRFYEPLFIQQLMGQTPANGYPNNYYWNTTRASFLSIGWIAAAVPYIWGTLFTIYVYMIICKWTAIGMGLWLKSQMKAMIASILCILVLCFVPMLFFALMLIIADSNPSQMPLFFFASPMFIYGFNLADEMREVHRADFMPDSATFVLCLNLMIYGGLALFLKLFVSSNLSKLLPRRSP